MNDDDPTLLASAYLDEEASADERARVEADDTLLAEVERLRTVRALLGDVPAPSISVREAHLAGAFDAWERLPDTDHTVTALATAPRRARDRRRAPAWWSTAAAAGLIAVLAGGVALQLRSTGDDDSSSSTDTAADSQALTSRAAEAPAEEADKFAVPEPAGAEPDDVAGSELLAEAGDAAPPADDAGLVQLMTTADLADFAGAAIGAPTQPDAPTATSATRDGSDADSSEEQELSVCLGVDIIVGPAVYRDVAVVVGIDESRDLAIAYLPDTCAEVARVAVP